jgi:nitrite reductase (NADH) small subunit
MALHRIGSLSALPPGTVMEAAVGQTKIALCNVNGEIHALDGTCPHRGGPLGQGALHERTLVCPWHAWEFDCTTGENDSNPSIRQRRFAVKLEGDDILVDID